MDVMVSSDLDLCRKSYNCCCTCTRNNEDMSFQYINWEILFITVINPKILYSAQYAWACWLFPYHTPHI